MLSQTNSTTRARGSALRLSVALRLLVAASRDGKVTRVSARVRCVSALVVLDIARTDERILEAAERRVAVNLERLSARTGIGDGRCSDTAEVAHEGLEVGARGGRARGGGGCRSL